MSGSSLPTTSLSSKGRWISYSIPTGSHSIESNKVRRLIAKYLISKGCTRIQDYIFLADLPRPTYEEIKRDLAEVQSLYDNHDSIIVCPISTDQLHAMHVIGEQLDVDIITHKRNTLFY